MIQILSLNVKETKEDCTIYYDQELTKEQEKEILKILSEGQ